MVAGTIAAKQAHLGIVMPIARHAENRNGVIVLDLTTDPDELAALDSDEIARRVFNPGDSSRLGIRTVQLNKCPVIVPLNTLRTEDAERLGIDRVRALANAARVEALLSDSNAVDPLANRVAKAMTRDWSDEKRDVDASLYSGPFLSQADKARLAQLQDAKPSDLSEFSGLFEDDRLDEMLFRYRARNYPETLDEDEQDFWREDCALRLTDENMPWMTLGKFRQAMDACEWQQSQSDLRNSLERLLKAVQTDLFDKA